MTISTGEARQPSSARPLEMRVGWRGHCCGDPNIGSTVHGFLYVEAILILMLRVMSRFPAETTATKWKRREIAPAGTASQSSSVNHTTMRSLCAGAARGALGVLVEHQRAPCVQPQAPFRGSFAQYSLLHACSVWGTTECIAATAFGIFEGVPTLPGGKR